jgi:NodT family efflux transporter outer membrane factor (OMF) lipoprotein
MLFTSLRPSRSPRLGGAPILPATLGATLALALAGCTTVGPDFKGAPAAAPTAAARGAFMRADPAQTSAVATSARWWDMLRDATLSQLIDRALADSPNIAAANARIAQARAGLAANKTALIPTVSASAATPYINVPKNILGGNDSGRTDSLIYNLGFDASWEIDLFGGTHRKIEAATARAEAAEAGAADAQVTLSAEIARAYVALRARQAVLALLDQQAAVDARLVDLAQQRLAGGTAPEQPLAQLRGQAAQTEGDRAKARADIVVLIDQLAVLTGAEPGTLDATLTPPAPLPMPPASVAIGDPATLLRNRPDIRMAERQLAAANADIGAQISEGLPKISFMGLLGLGGPNIGDVVDPAKIIGLALPQLRWSLFDGGRNKAQVRNKRAAYDEAEAKYRNTVLTALQDAETSLTRFGGQRQVYGKALDTQGQAARAEDLQQQRARAGTIAASDALTAQRQRLLSAQASAAAAAELTTDYIAVQKALGLGWQPRRPEA